MANCECHNQMVTAVFLMGITRKDVCTSSAAVAVIFASVSWPVLATRLTDGENQEEMELTKGRPAGDR